MDYALRRTWHAEGLRWIASLLTSLAERLERPSPELAPLEPMPRITPRDEALYDLRHRLNNTW
jgi:hypothetical protein